MKRANRSRLSTPGARSGLPLILSEASYRGANFLILTLAAALMPPHELGLASVASLTLTAVGVLISASWSVVVQRMYELRVDDGLSWLGAFLASGAASVFLILFSTQIADLLGASSAAPLIIAVAPVMVLQQLSEVAHGIIARREGLAQASIVRLVTTAVAGGISVGALFFGAGPAGIVLFSLSAWALTTPIWIRMAGGVKFKIGTADQRRQLIRFLLPVLATNGILVAATNVDNLIIARQLGPASLSVYVLAFGMMSLPSYLIAHSMQRVLLPYYLKLMDGGSGLGVLSRSGAQAMEAMGTFAVITCASMSLTLTVVEHAFGAEWSDVTSVALALGPFAFIRLLLTPISTGLYATGRTRPGLHASIAQLTLGVPLCLWAVTAMGPPGVGLAMSAAAIGPVVVMFRSTPQPLHLLAVGMRITVRKSGVATVLCYCPLAVFGITGLDVWLYLATGLSCLIAATRLPSLFSDLP